MMMEDTQGTRRRPPRVGYPEDVKKGNLFVVEAPVLCRKIEITDEVHGDDPSCKVVVPLLSPKADWNLPGSLPTTLKVGDVFLVVEDRVYLKQDRPWAQYEYEPYCIVLFGESLLGVSRKSIAFLCRVL
jgi:hypothetical protein